MSMYSVGVCMCGCVHTHTLMHVHSCIHTFLNIHFQGSCVDCCPSFPLPLLSLSLSLYIYIYIYIYIGDTGRIRWLKNNIAVYN